MMTYLPLIFIAMIGFMIIMYVVLDGFTLGTGMLLPFMTKAERDIAMSVILPTWDGNQTWLVLGAATLYGAFPTAFSLLLPALYIPLLLMVVALLFRGVVFEFRLKSAHVAWDIIFSLASLGVTLIQGYMLAIFIQGFSITDDVTIAAHTAGMRPFTVITALSLVFGYSLLGATRLILKTIGGLQTKMFNISFVLSFFIALAMVMVSLMTLFVHPEVKQLWFNKKYWLGLSILPIITGFLFLGLWYSLRKQKEILPYWLSVFIFLCPYAGFVVSVYPYIVPYHMTLWQAASPSNSLSFLFVGAVIMLPVLLIYTGYSYRIFKGKVKDVLHY